MKDFGYFVNENLVKKRKRDIELAKSLRNNLIDRAKKVIKLNETEFSTIIFENLYDSFREICDAILALDGYKSYSHEASIIYLKKYKVEDSVLVQFDDIRFKRNSSKYYGKKLSKKDVLEIKTFYKRYFNKLLNILNKRLKEVKNE